MSTDTERAVYIQRIDPEHRDDYIEAHEDVPEGVSNAMSRGGVTEFELYVRGDLAVCLLEAEDIDTYLNEIDGDDDVEEWERYVAQFKREGVDMDDPDEPIPFMERIWTFSASADR
jgi:L-rhamnose mutarotase